MIQWYKAWNISTQHSASVSWYEWQQEQSIYSHGPDFEGDDTKEIKMHFFYLWKGNATRVSHFIKEVPKLNWYKIWRECEIIDWLCLLINECIQSRCSFKSSLTIWFVHCSTVSGGHNSVTIVIPIMDLILFHSYQSELGTNLTVPPTSFIWSWSSSSLSLSLLARIQVHHHRVLIWEWASYK